MHPTASAFLLATFSALVLLVVVVVLTGIARVRPRWTVLATITAVAWLALTSAAAATGVLRNFDARPPPFVLLLLTTMIAALALSLSPVGRALAELPLWLLVGFQVFRLPLELLMHCAAVEGVMPSVMSFAGRNLDILSGAGALVVALVLEKKESRALTWAWLAGATALLLNVLVVAVRATPLVRAFGDDQLNTWIAWPPFVWLPTVLVLSAVAGHVVIARKLLRR